MPIKMPKVDPKAKPYYLSDEDIQWVMDTIANMTDEEKVGQLFVNMVTDFSPEAIQKVADTYHPGALRYHNKPAPELWDMINTFQQCSKVPLLVASNCEQGGTGGVGGGTYVACGAAVAATRDPEVAYQTGKVGGAEAMAIGSNWNFAPVVDLLFNWRNTIVQTRSFCADVERTVEYAKAFMKGNEECGMATTIKHWPGDGTEENDQHLMMGINDLPCDEWMDTFGKVYKELIDYGVKTIMAGHIAQPAWQRKLADHELDDHEILPATLCPELMNGLLKTELGFNGMVVTDASHMIGMFGAMPRSQQVPQAIAAGCDMYLFFNDMEEDFGYMLAGYKNGIITEERMTDALMRILGTKASIGLHKKAAAGTIMAPKENIPNVVACPEFQAIAKQAADKAITLVKDTQKMLPLNPATHKKIRVYFLEGDGMVVAGKLIKTDAAAKVKVKIVEELEKRGFTVEFGEDYAVKGKMEDLKKNVDAVLVFIDQVGFAQYNTMRVKWTLPIEQPWYAAQVPTAFISLYLPNYLIDLTMSRTYINCYNDSLTVVESVIEKLCGESEFKGQPEENVWCGRWDTKL